MRILIQRTSLKWDDHTIMLIITAQRDDGSVVFMGAGVERTDYPQVPPGTYTAVCQKMYTKQIDAIWFGRDLPAPYHNFFLHGAGPDQVEGCHGLRYYLWNRLASAIGYAIGKEIEYRVIDAPLS